MSSYSSSEGRWVDNVTTIPPFINELKARKNAESPFLRLPLELKTRIYEFVCGGQIVHMNEAQRGDGLSHRLCHEELSEEEVQKKFDTSEAVWYAPETADRHTECCARRYPIVRRPALIRDWCKSPPNEMLETNILYCCRQMYLESQFVPYYANTFSFYYAHLLSQFCRDIPRRYKTVIRSLHVELKISVGGNEDTEDWNRAFQTMTTSLNCLQRLHISMELVSVYWPCHADQIPAEKSMLSHILQAGKLDLKVATVVLWDSDFKDGWFFMKWSEDAWNEYERLERWTLAQKQEWSRYLRKALLHYEDRGLDLARLKREALEERRVCRL